MFLILLGGKSYNSCSSQSTPKYYSIPIVLLHPMPSPWKTSHDNQCHSAQVTTLKANGVIQVWTDS